MKSFLFGLALAVSACDSHAVGRIASVEIMNRDTGQVLPVYHARGEYWVAGTPGARYAVMVRNLTGQRIMAVTSVDGVNVISGETGAYDQDGYVFAPNQQYAIDGWRKSDREIAAFNFTALPDSYAARTGRAANVGVIGLALFQEQERPAPPPPAVERYAPPASPAENRARREASTDAVSPTQGGVPKVAGLVDGIMQDKDASRLGTGHGAREYSYVSSTEFERRTSYPGEIIRIRYDRYENLVAMGVVRARPIAPVPNPFPDSGQDRFVPDPPRPVRSEANCTWTPMRT